MNSEDTPVTQYEGRPWVDTPQEAGVEQEYTVALTLNFTAGSPQEAAEMWRERIGQPVTVTVVAEDEDILDGTAVEI